MSFYTRTPKTLTPAQVTKAKSDVIIIRGLIEQYIKAGDHKMVDLCTQVLENLHEAIEEVEGPSIDPDTRVC